jgi:hypothetical protein
VYQQTWKSFGKNRKKVPFRMIFRYGREVTARIRTNKRWRRDQDDLAIRSNMSYSPSPTKMMMMMTDEDELLHALCHHINPSMRYHAVRYAFLQFPFEREPDIFWHICVSSIAFWYGIGFFFFLWLYSPIQTLTAFIKLSISLQLLDLGQSVGLLGRVISSSLGLSVHKHRKRHTQHKH